MIIKIIPETDFEKQKYQEVEHTNIRSFFIFGNKKDKDGDLIDFHEWTGPYRYLEGSLYYFLTTISEERKAKSHKGPEISLQPPSQPQFQPKSSLIQPPFIKKGAVEDPNVQIVDVEEMHKKVQKEAEKSEKQNVLKFPPKEPKAPQMPSDNGDEFVESPVENDESKNAEDNEEKE